MTDTKMVIEMNKELLRKLKLKDESLKTAEEKILKQELRIKQYENIQLDVYSLKIELLDAMSKTQEQASIIKHLESTCANLQEENNFLKHPNRPIGMPPQICHEIPNLFYTQPTQPVPNANSFMENGTMDNSFTTDLNQPNHWLYRREPVSDQQSAVQQKAAVNGHQLTANGRSPQSLNLQSPQALNLNSPQSHNGRSPQSVNGYSSPSVSGLAKDRLKKKQSPTMADTVKQALAKPHEELLPFLNVPSPSRVQPQPKILVKEVTVPKLAKDKTRSLMVCGLYRGLKRDDITKYFAQFGTVFNCTSPPCVNDIADGLKYLFVKFTDYDSVEKAVVSSVHVIKGIKVSVRRAKDFL